MTDWLLQKAQVEQQTQQEHGYYSAARRFTLSPVTILTFQDANAQQTFEKYAYTNFSGKHPLHYWDSHGNRLQHWKGGWHKIVITNYLSKIDLTINMALTTAMHILTTQPSTPYTGTNHLSHRTTDKQIYDLQARKVIAKATYDKDKGILALITQGDLTDMLRNYWHEAWREAHKDHPRYPSYNRIPIPSDICRSKVGRRKARGHGGVTTGKTRPQQNNETQATKTDATTANKTESEATSVQTGLSKANGQQATTLQATTLQATTFQATSIKRRQPAKEQQHMLL